MDELIERLQLKRDVWHGTEFGDDICELLDEAADALEAMRAEVDMLRGKVDEAVVELLCRKARADKLAEALRDAADDIDAGVPPEDAAAHLRARADMLRDQEEGQ